MKNSKEQVAYSSIPERLTFTSLTFLTSFDGKNISCLNNIFVHSLEITSFAGGVVGASLLVSVLAMNFEINIGY